MELPHIFDFWLKILALTIDEVISFHYQHYFYTDTDADSMSVVAGPGRGRKGRTALSAKLISLHLRHMRKWNLPNNQSSCHVWCMSCILLFFVHCTHYQSNYTVDDLGIPLCGAATHVSMIQYYTASTQWAEHWALRCYMAAFSSVVCDN